MKHDLKKQIAIKEAELAKMIASASEVALKVHGKPTKSIKQDTIPTSRNRSKYSRGVPESNRMNSSNRNYN